MKNRPISTEGGSAYYVCRPRARHASKARRAGLSDKHITLTLCVPGRSFSEAWRLCGEHISK